MLPGKSMELIQLICRVLTSIFADTRVYMATRTTKSKTYAGALFYSSFPRECLQLGPTFEDE